jgi:hypothetical protein
MKRVFTALLVLVPLLVGGTTDRPPVPAPLVTEREARSHFPELRLPTYLPEVTVGPAFTVHSVDGLPLVTLNYSYTMKDLKIRGFQIQEAPPSLRAYLLPRPIAELPARSAFGLIATMPEKALPEERVLKPHQETWQGYLIDIVRGNLCEDPLCEDPIRYVQAMTCDERICARIEGPLEEDTAKRVLLSLFEH